MCDDRRENFSKRFQDLNGRETQMDLFQKSFRANVKNVNGASKTWSQTKLCTRRFPRKFVN